MTDVTLPQQLADYLQQQIGPELSIRLMEALDTEPSVSIRLNPWKRVESETLDPLLENPVEWCPEGYYLRERPNFTLDPLLHAGAYYVQESSSMFVTHVVRQLIQEPVTMLDLCAAPGGKSTALLSSLPEGSTLISNEVIPKRAAILAENVFKWSGFIDKPTVDVMVTNNRASDFRLSGMLFDAILADVPCSGEGMMRKDMEARRQWSPALVEQCAALQREIVGDIWPCLRPGGLLIYSTCTFNSRENEDNLAWIATELGAEPIYIKVEGGWNIHGEVKGSLPACRFLPGMTRGEGLFMAALRKCRVQSAECCSPKRLSQRQKMQNGRGKGLRFLSNPNTLPQNNAEGKKQKAEGRNELYCDLPRATAISYLAREAIVLPEDSPQGMTLIGYKGLPLGYAKNIGSRANNLYPKEWRIRKLM